MAEEGFFDKLVTKITRQGGVVSNDTLYVRKVDPQSDAINKAEQRATYYENEARAKQCDYFVYTVATQLKEPGSGGLPPASLPKGVTLDPAKFQAMTGVTLYKVGKPAPELKDVLLAADASQFAVDAVMTTFILESEAIAKQIGEDAHPQPAAKSAKTPAKRATTTKPK